MRETGRRDTFETGVHTTIQLESIRVLDKPYRTGGFTNAIPNTNVTQRIDGPRGGGGLR